jgi:thiol:disulfide interchange protein DsbD
MTHSRAPTKSLRAILALLAFVFGGIWAGRGLCPQARAAESLIAATLNVDVSLVSDVDRITPGQPFRIGLLFGLGPGWHIYWINPGDAGAAPTLDVTLPQGGSAGAIHWPIPKLMIDGSVTSYGYTRKTAPVLLPLTVTPPKALLLASSYTVKVAASWLVCKDICVPGSANFRLSLPVAAKPVPSHEASLFLAVDRRMPTPVHWPAWIAPDGTLSVDRTGCDQRGLRSDGDHRSWSGRGPTQARLSLHGRPTAQGSVGNDNG